MLDNFFTRVNYSVPRKVQGLQNLICTEARDQSIVALRLKSVPTTVEFYEGLRLRDEDTKVLHRSVTDLCVDQADHFEGVLLFKHCNQFSSHLCRHFAVD